LTAAAMVSCQAVALQRLFWKAWNRHKKGALLFWAKWSVMDFHQMASIFQTQL